MVDFLSAIRDTRDDAAVGQARRTLLQDRARSQDQQGAINAFFQDPARQQEIGRLVQAQQGAAEAQAAQQLAARQRQEAFQRARTGNVGGSFQAGQQAQLQATGQRAATQIAAEAQRAQDQSSALLEEQRRAELARAIGIDPFADQALQAQLGLLGVEGSENQALAALRRSRQQQQSFANDELSRILGGLVTQGGNLFEIDQLAKLNDREGLF